MRETTRPQPIHPADCACPHCDPQLLSGRQLSRIEIGVCALIVTASFVAAAFAIFGATT